MVSNPRKKMKIERLEANLRLQTRITTMNLEIPKKVKSKVFLPLTRVMMNLILPKMSRFQICHHLEGNEVLLPLTRVMTNLSVLKKVKNKRLLPWMRIFQIGHLEINEEFLPLTKLMTNLMVLKKVKTKRLLL